MSLLESIFSVQGPLSSSSANYRRRAGQIELAQAIESSLNSPGSLIAEAGTGVGKTFSYLVPILLAQKKALISTATRHLQDQLFFRDLPQVKAALGVSCQVSLLKGRSNYLCLHRLDRQRESGRFARAADAQAMRFVERFSAMTTTGDISECTEVPESSAIWPLVTSTRENCLGQSCPQLKDCHLMSARKRAQDADVLVVNHHLLCADLAIRGQGASELLPEVNAVVIDEAHSLPDIAMEFFGQSVSSVMLSLFARDCLALGLESARDAASWPDLCGAIERQASELAMSLRQVTEGLNSSPAREENMAAKRLAWAFLEPGVKQKITEKLFDAQVALKACEEVLSLNSARSIELVQMHLRIEEIILRIDTFLKEPQDASEPVVRWIEQGRNNIAFHLTPYDISARFRSEVFDRERSWIFVSATLSVAGGFTHFQDRLGLHEASCLMVESPFDYARQGLLLVPNEAPDPKAPDLIIQLLNDPGIKSLLTEAPGGIFILCTSLRAVDQAARLIRQWQEGLEFSRLLLVQGESPRHQLLDTFREHGQAILVGSHSFWEGVDVPGAALSMVFIDKIPFAVPDDPVLEARARELRQQGRDPFMSLQVPQAAILLKQGVGRLIRSETDRGLILVGDRRLAQTPYGRKILASLPGYSRTRSIDEARAWVKTSPELKP